MSMCLNDERLQAVADGEASADEVEHVHACGACRSRVANAREAIADFGQLMSEVRVPAMLASRVAGAMGRASSERAGATTLRHAPRSPMLRPAWLVGGAIAAAVLVIVFIVFPSVDPGTRLNAAEILDRSLQTLVGQGTERLHYELTIEAPAALTVDRGTYRIEQLIDHDSGRWRFARFATDGTLLNGISEDPATGIREVLVRLDGQTYRFRFAVARDQQVRLWDLQRRGAEAMIRLVQASAGQVVSVEDGVDGERYVVQLAQSPRTRGSAEAPGVAALIDLHNARVVVDASDFHIVEFSAGGSALGADVSIGYRLLTRDVTGPGTPASDFELPRDDPDTIELEGPGTHDLPRDVLTLLLRRVAAATP